MVRVTTQCVFLRVFRIVRGHLAPLKHCAVGDWGRARGGFRVAGCVAGQCAHVASQAVESCEQSYLHTLWAPHILFGGPACAPAHCTGI